MVSSLDKGLGLKPLTNEWTWFMSGSVEEGERIRHIPLNKSRFQIGRRPDRDLCLSAGTVSGAHAEIIVTENAMFLNDLKSTNGTYVNGHRIDRETPIGEGDLIHFGGVEFRVGRRDAESYNCTVQCTAFNHSSKLMLFERLLSEPGVVPYFQPIISLQDESNVGFEVLARSNIEGLENPRDMFMTATQLNLEQELSEVCRRQGIDIGKSLPGRPYLFVNTHPVENLRSGLMKSLTELRNSAPDQRICLEIHEAAVTDLEEMKELRSLLRDLNVDLAYDDFGAGQARLLDLVEVPPDYLKFDISLVRDIHKATAQRQQMVATLVTMVCEFGIVPLAEGIESAADATTCRELNFELAQGYLFGRPSPVETYQAE